MSRFENVHHRIYWITRTGFIIALLIALQWATSGTQVYAGQYITGSCVNCVLAIAALTGGLWCGIAVALISPVCAFLLSIGPALIQIVPCIALGNAAFVVCLYFFAGGKKLHIWQQAVGMVLSAVAKFAVLYIAVVKIAIPVMGEALKAPQIQKFTVMFSWPQLFTALIGGSIALLILPILKKAIKK